MNVGSPRPPLPSSNIDEVTGHAVVAEHFVRGLADDVEIAVRAKPDAFRLIDPAAGSKHVDERPGRAVETWRSWPRPAT